MNNHYEPRGYDGSHDDDRRARRLEEERRWRTDGDERRSFEGRRPDGSGGRYGQARNGASAYGSPYGREGYAEASYAGSGRHDAYDSERYRGRSPEDWREQRTYPAQRAPHGYEDRTGYQGRPGGQSGGEFDGNEIVQRVADGDFGPGVGMMGLGQHRGRGPKNYTRSDERIREDVNDRLSDDSWLDASDIEVEVIQCEVTLSGLVRGRADRRRAEDLAEQVSGVRHVQNNLRVDDNRDGRPQAGAVGPGNIPIA